MPWFLFCRLADHTHFYTTPTIGWLIKNVRREYIEKTSTRAYMTKFEHDITAVAIKGIARYVSPQCPLCLEIQTIVYAESYRPSKQKMQRKRITIIFKRSHPRAVRVQADQLSTRQDLTSRARAVAATRSFLNLEETSQTFTDWVLGKGAHVSIQGRHYAKWLG